MHTGEDNIRQGNVLIRANFNIEPTNLNLTKWGEMYAEAQWLEQWRLNNMAEMLHRLFGGENEDVENG